MLGHLVLVADQDLLEREEAEVKLKEVEDHHKREEEGKRAEAEVEEVVVEVVAHQAKEEEAEGAEAEVAKVVNLQFQMHNLQSQI